MRASSAHPRDLGLPSIYLHLLAEQLRSIGVDEKALLLRVGLDPARLDSLELRVTQSQAAEFVTRAIIESGEPGLGIMLAKELKLPLLGTLGTAVMSSNTLSQALELLTRYLSLRAPILQVHRSQEFEQEVFELRCRVDLGPVQNFLLDTVLFGVVCMGFQLLGNAGRGSTIRRRGPEPAYFQRFEDQIPARVRYNCETDALVIPADALNLPLRFSDGQLAASSRRQCEVALQQLNDDAGFTTRSRRVIETSHPFPPKLARVAATLFVSERTLKRRLQEEGSNFQSLVDAVRLERAAELLRDTHMNLGQIAEALGYADAANFTRAFKRWTQISPSAYRANHLKQLRNLGSL